MCRQWRFAAAVGLAVLCPPAATMADPVEAGAVKGNVEVRLLAARTSDRRGQELIAKFETRDKARAEVLVRFPSHSFTTHESTLMGLIQGCVERDPGPGGWRSVKGGVEAVFSVPAGGANDRDTLERCFLVLLELKSDK
jgi:hypothetical protein